MDKKDKYTVGSDLSPEENNMLMLMVEEEQEIAKKSLPDSVSIKNVVNRSSFVRGLIVKEYKRRKRFYKNK